MKNWVRREFQPIIDFYKIGDAFQNFSFSLPFTYQALDSAYRNAKFILTMRTSAEEGYESLIRPHRRDWQGQIANRSGRTDISIFA